MSRLSILSIILVLSLSYLSCSEEEVVAPPVDEYKELTQRDHVIQNLDAAYREGAMDEVERTMHESFSFCYPNDPTRCWPRAELISSWHPKPVNAPAKAHDEASRTRWNASVSTNSI